MKQHSLSMLGAAALLTACGSQASKEEAPAAANAAADATGPASAEQSNPASATAAGDPLVYPGSRPAGDNQFTTSDPVDRVVDWYWGPDKPMQQRNGQLWTVSKPEKRDDGYLVHLTIVDDADSQSIAVYLTPRADGGTDGRIRPITEEEIKSGVKL